MAICDRGYRGKRQIGAARIEIVESGKGTKTKHEKRKARDRLVPGGPFLEFFRTDNF